MKVEKLEIAKLSDEELIQTFSGKLYPGSEEKAFNEIYRRYSHQVFNCCKRLCHNNYNDAKDIFQEVWRRFFESVPHNENEIYNVIGYLWQIAQHCFTNLKRNQRDLIYLEEDSLSMYPESETLFLHDFSKDDVMEICSKAQISSIEKDVLDKRYYENQTRKQISESLGLTNSVIRTIEKHGIEKLRNFIVNS
jgi:RNA polymerase sigma factor (sigma-70 family)